MVKDAMISLTSLFNGPWFSFSTHSGNDNCENEQNSAFHYFLSAFLIPWLTTPTNQYKFTHSLDLIFFHGKTLWRSWIIVLILTILYGVLEINYHLNTYLFKPQLNFCETFCSMTVCLICFVQYFFKFIVVGLITNVLITKNLEIWFRVLFLKTEKFWVIKIMYY